MIDSTRRGFLQNVALATAGTAVASHGGATPSSPLTEIAYPIVEASAPSPLVIATRERIPAAWREKMRAQAPALELGESDSDAGFHRALANAHVIYGAPSREEFAAAPQLKWIQYTAAGVEHTLWPELVESPVVLTNMQRIYAPVISESVIAFLLALARNIPQYTLQTRARQWKPVEGLTEISGMTMGIAGIGGIGTATAYRAHYGFGMRILAVDPKPVPKPAFVEELHTLDWLPTMASQVDVLVSAAPHTRVSENMFNAAIFSAMKPSAYFINVSRGKLVETPALIRALKEKRIAGAALDVAYREPLPPEDALWDAPNLIITSHTSAHSPKVLDRQMELFTENIRRYTNGLPLLNVVDKRRGY